MVWSKAGSIGKILIGVIIGIILVCLVIAVAILAIYYFGLNVSTVTHTYSHSILLKPAGNATMSDEQIVSTMGVLHSRFTECGYNVSMTAYRNQSGVPYMKISYNDIPSDKISVVATTPGIFEMRIQTSGNESEHVFFGDEVTDAGLPFSINLTNGDEKWGVQFSLTNVSSEEFKQTCFDSGAIQDPENHSVITLLDDKLVDSVHISPDLARYIPAHPIDVMIAWTGTGDEGREMARNLSMCLRSGALPVKIEVVSPVNINYNSTVPLS